MKNPHNIENIISELYAIEPELREHDSKIREIITAMLAGKPQADINPTFVENLKVKLLEKADQILPTNHSMKFFNPIQKAFAVPALAGLTLITIATIGVTSFLNTSSSPSKNLSGITMLGSNAFGPLNADIREAGKGGGAGLQLGMGGGGNAVATAPAIAPLADDAEDTKLSIWPGPFQYEYVYKGETFTLTDSKVPVLRRIKSITSPNSTSILGPINNFFNLSALSNIQTQNINLIENRDFGYMVYVDYIEGTVSFNANWQKWPHPEQECRDEACYARYRLNISDVPSDAEVIALADSFLVAYGIKTDNMNKGMIRNEWRTAYDSTPDKNNFYVPEVISVVYPQIVNNEIIYDEAGFTTGITVNVNIRHKKVDGTWGIATQNYESSEYDAETNVEKLLALVGQGGYPQPIYEQEIKKIQVELGTPEKILMKTYRWNGITNEELLSPALRFPVTKKPEGQPYFQDSVTIPLVQDLLNQRYGVGGPMIMYSSDMKIATPPSTT